MNIRRKLFLIILIFNCTVVSALPSFNGPDIFKYMYSPDTVVIPFEHKQSALYQVYTLEVIDSIIGILLRNDSVTLTINGYAHVDEGNDTISKYLSLNRALFIRDYVIGRGVDSSRIISVKGHGKIRKLYLGTRKQQLGNSRVEIMLNYPPPEIFIPDTDGDNLNDSLDSCPNVYGEDSLNGCPPHEAVIVPFEGGQTALVAQGYGIMDSIIKVLRSNPGFTITLSGHAYKTEGVNSVCEKLAKERAIIVRDYFQSRYIPATRIKSINNYGCLRNINAGRNPREILKNSRVEIIVLQE